ncbi:MAG: M23 family metallopeptidase [Candidatus Latescibacteria bacterium]|nr:M23 family metallopeptidase [Candidatus Latescibacterota bacterium]
MSWKRLTFILIPHSKSEIKQIGIPRALVFGLMIAIVLTTGIMIFYILGFEGKSFYADKTREIINNNRILEKHLAYFDSSLTTMSSQLDSLEKIKQLIGEKYEIPNQIKTTDEDLSVMVAESGLKLPLQRVLYLIDRMEKKSDAFTQNYTTLYDFCDKNCDFLKTLPSIKPASGEIMKKFGRSFDRISNTRKLHPGVDINNVEGTPIVATADGIIEDDTFTNEFGRYIIIDHGNGYKTRYTHLQRVAQMKEKIKLKVGEQVTRGQQIACMGRTGTGSILAVPPHIMYSVLHHGVPVDPEDYFFASDYADQPENNTYAQQNF